MAAVAHPGDKEDERFIAGVGDSVSVAAVDVVGRANRHLLHPRLSISIHEDQCALPFQRPHEFASIWIGVEVAAGHVELAAYLTGLEDGGGVEQSGFAFNFSRTAVSLIDQLVGVVDGICEDRSEFAEGSMGLSGLAFEDAGLEIENQSVPDGIARSG